MMPCSKNMKLIWRSIVILVLVLETDTRAADQTRLGPARAARQLVATGARCSSDFLLRASCTAAIDLGAFRGHLSRWRGHQ